MELQSLGRGGRGLWAYPVGGQTRSWILTYNSLQHPNNPSSPNHSFITQLVKYVLRGQGGPPFNQSKVGLRKPHTALWALDQRKSWGGREPLRVPGTLPEGQEYLRPDHPEFGAAEISARGQKAIGLPCRSANTQLVSEAQQHNECTICCSICSLHCNIFHQFFISLIEIPLQFQVGSFDKAF